jgi:hypothetical protein
MLRRVALVSFSETSVLKTATRCNFPEEPILHSHRCENLKSYMEYKLLYEDLKYLFSFGKFQFLKTPVTRCSVFWGMMQSKVKQTFGGIYHFHFQSRK